MEIEAKSTVAERSQFPDHGNTALHRPLDGSAISESSMEMKWSKSIVFATSKPTLLLMFLLHVLPVLRIVKKMSHCRWQNGDGL